MVRSTLIQHPRRRIALTILLLSTGAPAAPAAAAPEPPSWQTEALVDHGSVEPHSLSLATDVGGHIYVSYADTSAGVLWVGDDTGGDWATRMVDTVGQPTCGYGCGGVRIKTSLAVVPHSGVVHLTYTRRDIGLPGPILYRSSLDQYGSVESAGIGMTPVIALDGDYRPWVVFATGSGHGSPTGLVLSQRTETGWVQEVITDPGLLDQVALDPDLAISRSDGRIHLVYAGAPDSGIPHHVYHLSRPLAGGAWQISDLGDGHYPQLELDGLGRPRIVFTRVYDASTNAVVYATWDGTAWVFETLPLPILVLRHTRPGFALDRYDQPAIAFANGDSAYVTSRSDGWTAPVNLTAAPIYVTNDSVVPVAADSLGGIHTVFSGRGPDLLHSRLAPPWFPSVIDQRASVNDTSIAADQTTGEAFVTYTQTGVPAVDGHYYATSEGFAECMPPRVCGAWGLDVIRYGSYGGTSLARTFLGLGRASAYVSTTQDLEFAFQTTAGGAWRKEIIDSAGDVGRANVLLLTSLGEPHVIYTDVTQGLLKYAWKDTNGWHIVAADPSLVTVSATTHVSAVWVEAAEYLARPTAYISVYDASSGDLVLMTFDKQTWQVSRFLADDTDVIGPLHSLGAQDGPFHPDRPTRLALVTYNATRRALVLYDIGVLSDMTIDTTRSAIVHNVGTVTSLSPVVFTHLGTFWFAYTTAEEGAARVVKVACYSGRCVATPDLVTVTTIDSGGGARDHISLAAGANRLHVSYRGPNGELVVANQAATVEMSSFNPFQPCLLPAEPALAALEHAAAFTPYPPAAAAALGELDVLRGLRDVLATDPDGQRLITLYYTHAAETGAIGLSDPDLAAVGLSTLRSFLPGWRALLGGQGQQHVITQGMVDEVNAVLDRLAAAGSPDLQRAIATERAATNQLQDFVGRDFDQALMTLGVPPPVVLFLPVIRR